MGVFFVPMLAIAKGDVSCSLQHLYNPAVPKFHFEISKHLNIRQLFLACVPMILMMISISIYSVVDGFFVSNFAGKTPFAAVNLIYPFIMTIGSIGFMMGTGGTALVAKRMGEGRHEEANRLFFSCFIITIVLGIVSSLSTVFLLPQIAHALGASDEMLPYCVDYGRILILGITFFNLQNMFQPFFAASGKPQLGFAITIGAGVVNIVLDAVLVVGCGLGCIGAAWGTVMGQAVGGLIPIGYYVFKNRSSLRLKPSWIEWKSVGRMITNGFSEFVNNVVVSIVSVIMNVLLMKYYGENGVSAYGIICYVWLIFGAGFIGLCMGISPRISYAYGEKNKAELQSLTKNALILFLAVGIFEFIMAEALTVPLSYLYAGYDESLRQLTVRASLIYSTIYVILGINMFGSAFFTALNNGLISAALSFGRLMVFEATSIYLCSLLFQGDGVWWGVPIGESLGVIMTLLTIYAAGRRYGYRSKKQTEVQEKASE